MGVKGEVETWAAVEGKVIKAEEGLVAGARKVEG